MGHEVIIVENLSTGFIEGVDDRTKFYDCDLRNLKGIDLISSIKNKGQLVINGDDYNTPDGTRVRDFIHVEDLAETHISAVENINEGNSGIYNLSICRGTSIVELKKLTVDGMVGPKRWGPCCFRCELQ